jgi:hypothetical protein
MQAKNPKLYMQIPFVEYGNTASIQHCCNNNEGSHAKVGRACTLYQLVWLEQIVQ